MYNLCCDGPGEAICPSDWKKREEGPNMDKVLSKLTVRLALF